jgi:hypothetical protein
MRAFAMITELGKVSVETKSNGGTMHFDTASGKNPTEKWDIIN